MTAYLLSVSVRKRDPACTVFHSPSVPSCFCMSYEADLKRARICVYRCVSFFCDQSRQGWVLSLTSPWHFEMLGRDRMSTGNRCERSVEGGVVLVLPLSMLLVLAANWFTRPKKDRRSVRLLCVGKREIASVISSLMVYPSGVRMNPANNAVVWQNLNFSRFREMPFSWQRRSNSRT